MLSNYKRNRYNRTRIMRDEEILITISAVDERTKIILDQQKYMREEISILKSKPSTCSLHAEMEKRIQKLRLSDAKFTGELNILDLKTKTMITGGVVIVSSIVSLIVSKLALMIF